MVSSVRFGGAPLDLRHGPAIEGVVSKSGRQHFRWFNPRFQLLNRPEYGPT